MLASGDVDGMVVAITGGIARRSRYRSLTRTFGGRLVVEDIRLEATIGARADVLVRSGQFALCCLTSIPGAFRA